ncbi:Kcnb2 [Symbiodinium natans]|uniref:Kcnb2 protein n=1 Tax=Symbiodinium natans TaxID=878477 RepID=A0A812IHK3_9DINO|nr:Kcnb2 [Symbiodinium natans]
MRVASCAAYRCLQRLHASAEVNMATAKEKFRLVCFNEVLFDFSAEEFSADEYDVDGSGAVGWYEFVTVWRKVDVSVKLSLPERVFVLMEEPTSSFVGVMASCLPVEDRPGKLIAFRRDEREVVSQSPVVEGSCLAQLIGICVENRVGRYVGFMIATLPEMKEHTCDGCEPEQRYIVRVCSAPFTRTELLHYEQFLEHVTDNQVNYTPSRFVRLMLFVIQPMNLIDLFVIIPFVVESSLYITTANFTVLRVLRLTRLFRLVKLGKSFEVLQIIGRVFHKSIAMFWVFAVNLSLAMCFSAATIYFVEGGEWDDDEKTYLRTGHDGKKSETPFLSIPHSFWWVFVTFTTVGQWLSRCFVARGYGDVVPETFLGKLIGASSMLVGIFVLALPISVISTTFGEVWHEWKEELRLEAQSREEDLRSVELALQIIENRTHLTIELYDHSDRYPPEFLGQVQYRTLPLDVQETVECSDESFQLKSSFGLQRELSLGEVVLGYTWKPSEEQDMYRYSGTLEVRMRRAQGLLPSDWKKHGKRNVYALVRCWPKPPESQRLGQSFDVTFYTRIVDATLDPVWDETFEFEFDWPCDWRPQKEPSPPRLSTRFQQDSPMTLRRDPATCTRRWQFEWEAWNGMKWHVQRANTIAEVSILREETQDLNEVPTLRPDNDMREIVEAQAAELRQLRHEAPCVSLRRVCINHGVSTTASATIILPPRFQVGTLSRTMGDLLPLLQSLAALPDAGRSIPASVEARIETGIETSVSGKICIQVRIRVRQSATSGLLYTSVHSYGRTSDHARRRADCWACD